MLDLPTHSSIFCSQNKEFLQTRQGYEFSYHTYQNKAFETGLLRLTERPRIAKTEKIDFIHRFLILSHPVLTNSMYQRLCHDDLSINALQLFANDYFFASAQGFLKSVLPRALKVNGNKLWRNYIKNIITEECKPKPHYQIFQEFLESCELPPLKPIIAGQFISNMIAGYEAETPFAIGYALGIEVEADYQINLLYECMSHYFPQQVKETIWFDIHLDEAGEEEHAKITVELIEHFSRTEDEITKVRQGFYQACNDTNAFMEGLNTLVTLAVSFNKNFDEITENRRNKFIMQGIN